MAEISLINRCLQGISEYHRRNDNRIVPLSMTGNNIPETLVIKMSSITLSHMLNQSATMFAIASGVMDIPDCRDKQTAYDAIKRGEFGRISDAKIVLCDDLLDDEFEITTEIGG